MYRNNNIIVEIACMIALRHFFQKNQKCPRGHDGWQICLCCRKKPIPCLEGSKVTPPTLWRQGLVLLLNLNQICHPSWPRRHLSLFCKIACFGEEYLWNTSTLNGHHLGYRHARRLRFFFVWTVLDIPFRRITTFKWFASHVLCRLQM